MKSLKKELLTSSDPHQTILPNIYFDILSGICSGIFSSKTFQQVSSPPLALGILSGKSSDILYGIFYLAYLRIFLWLRSGGERSDPELAVEVRLGTLKPELAVRAGTFAPELAVEVRRGTL